MEYYQIQGDTQETPEPDEDKTFKKLKNIQTILKKELALKELCK